MTNQSSPAIAGESSSTKFTLPRTGMRPVTFTGEVLVSEKTPNFGDEGYWGGWEVTVYKNANKPPVSVSGMRNAERLVIHVNHWNEYHTVVDTDSDSGLSWLQGLDPFQYLLFNENWEPWKRKQVKKRLSLDWESCITKVLEAFGPEAI